MIGHAGARRLLALAALFLFMALAIATARAEEITRESYREAVEPICKVNTQANERILAGVRDEVKRGKLKPAAAHFERAARALKRTLGELRVVPRPPADEARLKRWMADVEVEVGLFEQVAAKLRAGDKAAAERRAVRLTTNANRANNVVIPFEFHYCRFEPSRFT